MFRHHDGPPPGTVYQMRQQIFAIGDDFWLRGAISGPFSLAISLVGAEALFLACLDQPDWVRSVMACNPVAVQVETLRDAWLQGRTQPSTADLLALGASLIAWLLGHLLFQRLSPHFEEAL